MKLDKNIEYALSLSGGGYKGAYQAGVIMALHQEGYKFNAAVGASVGALNGAMTMQEEFESMKEMWHNERIAEVFKLENKNLVKALKLNLNGVNILDVGKEIFDIGMNGLDVEPMRSLIEEYANEKKLRKNQSQLGLVTINLSDKKAEEIMLEDMPENLLNDYLFATCYLPIFKRVKLHGKYYLDGGYYNNTPTNMLVERGYKNIIEIRLSSKEKGKDFNANVLSIIPSQDLGHSVLYNREKIDYNYQIGYMDGLRAAKNALGYTYVIENGKDEKYFINKFINLDPHILIEFEIENGKYESLERSVLNEFSVKLAKKLGINKSFSYERLYITLLEYAASVYELDKFHLYTLEEFEQEILNAYKKTENKDILLALCSKII